MDQIKIGKFIAECRKNNNLTQLQLADKLSITDKAISKWERGITMPDSSLMLELCAILKISVNELLSGEVIKMENSNKEMEIKLIEMIKEKESADKLLLKLEVLIGVLSCIILFIPIFLGAYLPIEKEWIRILVILSGFIPAFIGIFITVRLEQVAGYYECKECGHRYVPTYKAVSFAMHVCRTRKMKCPKCGKKSWQKKVINK